MMKVEVEDEMLPHLSVHTINDIPTKDFVRKLTYREIFQNRKIKPVHVVFKK
jgi:hypothetical protein